MFRWQPQSGPVWLRRAWLVVTVPLLVVLTILLSPWLALGEMVRDLVGHLRGIPACFMDDWREIGSQRRPRRPKEMRDA